MIQSVPHGEFSIKNLKSCQGMDGICYSCTIYRNGRKIAQYHDDGNGGMGMIRFEERNGEDEQAIKDHVESLPPFPSMIPNYPPLPHNIDTFISALADDFESTRKFKRICKTKTLVRMRGDQEGTYRTIPEPFTPDVAERIRRVAGNSLEEILNETINS